MNDKRIQRFLLRRKWKIIKTYFVSRVVAKATFGEFSVIRGSAFVRRARSKCRICIVVAERRSAAAVDCIIPPVVAVAAAVPTMRIIMTTLLLILRTLLAVF